MPCNECQWDRWEQWPEDAQPYRMALIADLQIVNPHTYPRRGIVLKATTFYTDLFMSKLYSLLNKILLPESTVFLGDLFDGGREWSTSTATWGSHVTDPSTPGREDWTKYNRAYWEQEFVRFNKIFPMLPGRRSIRSLPGNHDLGFGNGVNEGVVSRFKSFFGETNSVHTLGNHTFVLIDSVSLENTENPKIYEPARRFLDEFSASIPSPRKLLQQNPEVRSSKLYDAGNGAAPANTVPPISPLPKILLTHVPLYRPQNTPCGPLREGHSLDGTIPLRDILKKIQPILVASGDDHDYCEVLHAGATGMVKEITVKSFSMAMSVRRPGFLMLSLWNPVKEAVVEGGNDASTVQSRLCLLPDQVGIWQTYLMLFGITKFVVTLSIVWNSIAIITRSSASNHGSSGSSWSHYGGYGIPSTTSSPAPPYNEDDESTAVSSSDILFCCFDISALA
ncbi:Metallo-dependent phosphatase [Terfezia boudieri ATCC MYA-4762]|uniref:Metallo-dependent phosphatase n=1 Tax=Terfezia boudieri ATCC MYA-4762 TaxID=1051890 RepID=A0A3N4LCV5_9PEZI|nr:Metallo-dependent phosphatase [Terfezia boudieri ATCC MYA-4762]